MSFHIIDRIHRQYYMTEFKPFWFIDHKQVTAWSFQDTLSQLPYKVKVVSMTQSVSSDGTFITTWTVEQRE